MSETADRIRVLENWPQPESGAPEPRILANDSSFALRYYTQQEKIACIVFPLVNIFKFGSPNDEALGGHALIKNGLKFYSVHEIECSSWIQELEKQNSIHPQHNKERFTKDKHHYIFTFHDSTLELVSTEGEYWKPSITLLTSEEEAQRLFIEALNA